MRRVMWLGRTASSNGWPVPDSLPTEQLKGLSGLGWSQFKAGETWRQPQRRSIGCCGKDIRRRWRRKPPWSRANARKTQATGPGGGHVRPDHSRVSLVEGVAQGPDCGVGGCNKRYPSESGSCRLVRTRDQGVCEPRGTRRGALPMGLDIGDIGKPGEWAEVFEDLRKEYPHSRFWADATYRILERAFAAKEYARSRELAAALLAAKPEPSLARALCLYKGRLRPPKASGRKRWQRFRR